MATSPRIIRSREERLALMDKEILDVEGAAAVLGVSSTTIYTLARKGEIPATRVGREWRFSRKNLVEWVANGTRTDQLSALLKKGTHLRRDTHMPQRFQASQTIASIDGYFGHF